MKKQLLLVYLFLFAFQLGHSQFFEGFENTSGPDALPSTNWILGSGNWLVFDNGVGTGRWTINNTNATPPLVYNGTNAAYMNRVQSGFGNTSENYLVTPAITVPVNAKLGFYARTFTLGNQGTIYQIKVCPASSTATNPSNYTTIAEFTENEISVEHNIYEQKIINLPANLAGTQVHIAFVRKNAQVTAAIDGDRWLLDDVSVFQGCPVPSIPTVSFTTPTSASLSWNGIASTNQWEIEVLPTSITPTGFGVTYNGTSPYLATTTSYGSSLLQTPLTPNTGYKYYIRAICSGNIPSEWIGPTYFFTSSLPPVCGGTFTDMGGSNGNYYNNTTAATGTTTICPTVPGEQVTVSFTSFSTQTNLDVLSIYNGTVATPSELLGSFSGTSLPPSFTSSSSSGCLTFVFVSNGSVTSTGWIANITCAPPPECPKPIALNVSAVTLNSVILGWTDVFPGTAWQCLVLPQGSPAPNSTTTGWVDATINPFAYSGLVPGTCYTAYVRSDCTATSDGLSLWSSGINFCTLAGPPVCGGNFVDQGGIFGNYYSNSNNTVTICPTIINESVNVTFTSFNTEATFDALYVYNGNSITSPQIASQNGAGNVPGGLAGGYWGTILPGPFSSTSADGCLTFRFVSDSQVNYSGWKANVTCGDPIHTIHLFAFLDTNNNGIKDAGENPFTNGSYAYQLNDSGVTNYITPYYGIHSIHFTNTSNSYDFSYLINSQLAPYYTTSTSYTNVTALPGNLTQTLYFPIIQTNPYSDVSVTIASNEPVPGFSYVNLIIYKNNGISPVSGTINFVANSSVSITSISPSGTVPNATGFSYNYSNLLPSQTRYINVTMSVPPIPTVSLGTILTNTASITPTSSDINLTNNYFSSSRTVVGSLDPNDKSEAHGPQIPFSQFTANDYLYYHINFQNEGTADALTVRIEDLLDAQIDQSSIQMLDASHPYSMQRTNNQIIWTFDNINLPPKTVDEPLSKGYVSFRVKLNPGFALGDIIPNTAEIYFDTNPAIVTNTFNTEFTALGNDTFDLGNFVISPNPATTSVEIHLQNTSEIINSILITDVLGKTIRKISTISNNQATIDVAEFSKGVYFVEITTSTNLKQVKKLVIK